MGLANDYIDAIWDDLQEFAAWPPQNRLQLGDYGIWNGNVFIKAGNVRDLGGPGIPAMTETESDAAQTFFMGSSVTSVTFNAKATLQWPPGGTTQIATGGASVQVSFSKQDATWANLGNAKLVTLDNKVPLMNELLRRARDLDSSDKLWWDHTKYRVVTQLIRSDRFTIALSRSDNAAIVVEADAEAVDWGSGSINTSVTHQSGAVALFDAPTSTSHPYTTLFRTSHVVVTGALIHHWVDDSSPGD